MKHLTSWKNATGSPRNEKHLNHVLYTHPPADLPLVIVFGIVLTLKLTFLVTVSSNSRIIVARHLLPIYCTWSLKSPLQWFILLSFNVALKTFVVLNVTFVHSRNEVRNIRRESHVRRQLHISSTDQRLYSGYSGYTNPSFIQLMISFSPNFLYPHKIYFKMNETSVIHLSSFKLVLHEFHIRLSHSLKILCILR